MVRALYKGNKLSKRPDFGVVTAAVDALSPEEREALHIYINEILYNNVVVKMA